MFGWAGRLRNFFTLHDREYVLLCPQFGAGCGLLHLARSEETAEKTADWLVQDCICEAAAENFAEWAALQLLRHGWQKIPVLYLVPAAEVFGYVVKLPPQLGKQEWQEAAYWELDASLGERGLAAESFHVRSRLIPEQDNCAFTAAVRKDYLREVQADFLAAEVTLADVLIAGNWGSISAAKAGWHYGTGLTPLADAEESEALTQVMQSFLGYAECREERLPGLWERKRERLAYGRMAAAYAAIFFLLLGMVLAADVYKYQTAAREQAGYQAELVRLAPEAQALKEWQERKQNLAVKEKMLQKLVGKDIVWYPLLMHLGLKTTEGVYITELSGSEGKVLQLAGRALTYDALAEFMAGLEADKEFFPGGVKLEEAGTLQAKKDRPGKVIAFKLRIDMGDKTDDRAVAAKT